MSRNSYLWVLYVSVHVFDCGIYNEDEEESEGGVEWEGGQDHLFSVRLMLYL